MFRRLKISTQLIILFGLVITLSVILSTGYALFSRSQELRETLEDRGKALSELTADFLFTPLYFNDLDNVQELGDGLVLDEDINFAISERSDGTIAGQSGNAESISDDNRARVTAFARQQGETVLIETPDQLLVAVPVGRESIDAGTLIIGLSLENLQSQLQSTAIQLISFSLIWIVVGLVGTVLIARYLSKPIDNLTGVAQAISQGNYDVSLPPASSQELSTLSVTFEQMAAQLQELVETLEAQVAARTQRLEIIAVLGERLTAILDVEQLLPETVNQIQANFGYYHVYIYLFDEAQENLVVAAGAGAAGAEKKAARFSIPLNAPTSLVAGAARTREIVAVDNVRQTEGWLPNPLLPDTYAEMAVPIMLGVEGEVVGVLDVQENEVAGLDQGDANVLRSLANQVAVAVRNARLFQENETALARAETAQEQYVKQSWRKMEATSQGKQHHYARPNAPALDDAIIDRAETIAADEDQVTVVNLETGRAGSIVAPVKLRNQNIGALQLHPDGSAESWTEDDLAIVQAVVDQFVQTAENLRLFEETRERAGREATLREITDRLRSAPNLGSLLDIATRELGQRFAATHAKLELGIDTQQHPAVNGGNGRAEGE